MVKSYQCKLNHTLRTIQGSYKIFSTFGIIWSSQMTWKELLAQKDQLWHKLILLGGLFVPRVAAFLAFCISFSFLFFLSARKFKSTCRVRKSHRNILHSSYEIFKKPILMYSSSEFRSLDGDPSKKCVGVIQLLYQTPILDWSVIK